jgi:hypothetical protein
MKDLGRRAQVAKREIKPHIEGYPSKRKKIYEYYVNRLAKGTV